MKPWTNCTARGIQWRDKQSCVRCLNFKNYFGDSFDGAENSGRCFRARRFNLWRTLKVAGRRKLPAILGLFCAVGAILYMMDGTKLPIVFAFFQDGVEIAFVLGGSLGAGVAGSFWPTR